MSRSAKFRPHSIGVKTPRMLEVEARLGRTLEEDFREYYVEKGWGQKRLSRRWGVTRAAIFGRGKTTDLKCWIQVLQLPVRRDDSSFSPKVSKPEPACELCEVTGVPLEAAHWIAASDGGSTGSSNIIRLCPNCHTQLDLAQDSKVTEHARAVLLARVACRFAESPRRANRQEQVAFADLCKSIIERRNGT